MGPEGEAVSTQHAKGGGEWTSRREDVDGGTR